MVSTTEPDYCLPPGTEQPEYVLPPEVDEVQPDQVVSLKTTPPRPVTQLTPTKHTKQSSDEYESKSSRSRELFFKKFVLTHRGRLANI